MRRGDDGEIVATDADEEYSTGLIRDYQGSDRGMIRLFGPERRESNRIGGNRVNIGRVEFLYRMRRPLLLDIVQNIVDEQVPEREIYDQQFAVVHLYLPQSGYLFHEISLHFNEGSSFHAIFIYNIFYFMT